MVTFHLPQSKHQWAAAVLGAALLYFSGVQLWAGLRSKSWPGAEGEVISSTPYHRPRSYRVNVRYRYSWQGRDYTGDRYRFQSIFNRDDLPSSQVDAIHARYPLGEHMQVSVNPGDPSESVIAPGMDVDDLIPFGAGGILLLVGIATVRERPKEEWVVAPPMERAGPRYRTAKVLAAIGVLLLIWGGRYLYAGWSSLSWPVADGRILHSRMVHSSGYEAQLWYEYRVDGARYVADNYRTGGNSTPFKSVASATVKRYPVGQAVKVHYNPSNPAEAVLEPGAWYGNYVAPGIGVLMLGAAWVAKKFAEAIHSMKARRQGQP